jgi:hypothetical protein
MFGTTSKIGRFRATLVYLMSKQMLRPTQPCVVGLCILSMTIPLPHAMLAPAQIGHNSSITPATIVQVIPMNLPNSIFRRWIHSHEEDVGDILVYRPLDYLFPPARGREGLEFRENGEFISYQIGATDRNIGVPGKWSIKETNLVEIQFPNQASSSYTLTILECNEQILKIRQTTKSE